MTGLFSLQVTQLYVPSARHVWRTRRMGRIGPLQSTLDGTPIISQFFLLLQKCFDQLAEKSVLTS